ncbi:MULTISPECIES: PTS sugar transporter subunit IIA [Pseudonocardia]|uniref:PTS system fructose-specific EIIABC component n=2 Tax=Pseudonocardia TaxID=1847 RepID=A0A1Y2MYY0_PSEAH|nr:MULTISPECIES: fructose PTS transporter subunit IIA [Pseudonocardia]OSY39848.1 PTS system fructose-specific EIIABC component [Pseudonocardia autotrophica]TDN74444.1 PTS system D-fructose-specific IIA component (F1P-forming) (Frc family) [Pseudonocardia autotrophica]BBG05211.1 PTS fructose transporter subunit IIA [Pseudonocardia autotrophica]GEC25781.1 PTS fructose transporter subunit IIA [Pseudonocardia saturnea]
MSPLITADLVDLDVPSADRTATVAALAGRLRDAGRVTDLDTFLADIEAREAQMPTGLDGGIGIPHCRSSAVTEPSLAFGRSSAGVDFGAEDGPATLIFMIAAPEGGDTDHLTVLAALARRLVRASFTGELRSATDPAAVASFIQQEVGA